MRFSVIVPHYDGSVDDDTFCRGISCLLNQSFKDFETLIYHDGPVSRPIPDIWKQLPNSKLEVTKSRENNWGHGNRDRGIKASKGDYIVHFNPDNILYYNALAEIDKESKIEYPFNTNDNIIIFPIIMRGVKSDGKKVWRVKENLDVNYMIFPGFPPLRYNMDCMQLVMRSNIWDRIGGWKNKAKNSDSFMYPELVRTYGAKYCSKILGEHW